MGNISLQLRDSTFWNNVPFFLKQDIDILELGIKIIGYFPYHIARISNKEYRDDVEHEHPALPRALLHSFEKKLYEHNILDNKSVYICKSLHDNSDDFAIMIKDYWCMISDWDSVTQYSGKELGRKT